MLFRSSDPLHLLAVTAFLETRLQQLLQTPDLDPLENSELREQTRSEDLVTIALENEKAVAKDSLDAQLRHWSTGKPIIARDWIQQLYAEIHPVAKRSGILCFLTPIQQILRNGNQAQQWLKQAEKTSPTEVMQTAIAHMQTQEALLAQDICSPAVAVV